MQPWRRKKQIGFYWFNSNDWKFNEYWISVLDITMGRSTSSVVAIWVLGDWKCAMSCRNIKINSLPGPILNFWEPNNCYLHNRYDIYIVSIEMTCKLTFVRFDSIRFIFVFHFRFNELENWFVRRLHVIDSNKIKVKRQS